MGQNPRRAIYASLLAMWAKKEFFKTWPVLKKFHLFTWGGN